MKSRWYLRLARFVPRHWKKLFLIALLVSGTAALEALKPWPVKLFVDHVASATPFPSALQWLTQIPGGTTAVGQLAWLSFGTLLIFIAAWTMQAAQAYLQAGVALQMTYELGSQLFEHLQRLSLRYHGRRPSGDLLRRVMHDSRCVRELILDALVPGATAIITLISMVAFMLMLDSGLTLLALLVIPALAVADKVFYRPMMERSLEQQEWEGKLWSQAEETLTALPMVQSFGREPYEVERYRATTTQTLQAYFRALSAQLKFNVALNTATVLGRVVVMVVGGLHVLDGRLSVGGLLVFLAYLLVLYEPIDHLARLAATVAATEASAKRVFEVLDSADTIDQRQGARKDRIPARVRGHITWHRVSFGYEPEHRVLHDIEFEIKPGEKIAIVGRTGAGKSTLVSLLLRFFDPCEGTIRLDDVDLREIDVAELRQHIAILLQQPFLLPVSVAENIAYGRAKSARDKIISAAKAANAHEFISQLPQGYDTILGERGVTLSGGERQRIAIARALLKDSPILILDEPTSALDTRTEAALISALDRLTEGRTTLIIAHRLSTICRADRIVVLEHGKIVEVGTHAELIALRGAYYRYCALQAVEPQSVESQTTADVTALF